LIATLALLLLALAGCGEYLDFEAALPPSPSPFPTMARLATVTPVTPSPTLAPTPTRRPTTIATPTEPIPLEAVTIVGANVRAGPGTDFAVVDTILADEVVTLNGRLGEWYRLRTPDGIDGWMAAEVLGVPPEVAESVPNLEEE
jgi:hypothetical protein